MAVCDQRLHTLETVGALPFLYLRMTAVPFSYISSSLLCKQYDYLRSVKASLLCKQYDCGYQRLRAVTTESIMLGEIGKGIVAARQRLRACMCECVMHI